MKNRVLLVTGLCVGLFGCAVNADSQRAVKSEDKKSELKTTDVMTDSVKLEANVRFVETFTVMGEGESGQIYRKEIEAKRDLATQEIQEESKKLEKAKNEYVSKSSTMTDAAREKEEKKLMKMDRDLKNMVSEKEEELKLDMQIATEKLVQEMEVAVVELAQQENIDIVFDKMTGRAIYVSEEFDYTEKVLNKVNKNHQVKIAQNKKQQEAVRVADNKKVSSSIVKS